MPMATNQGKIEAQSQMSACKSDSHINGMKDIKNSNLVKTQSQLFLLLTTTSLGLFVSFFSIIHWCFLSKKKQKINKLPKHGLSKPE